MNLIKDSIDKIIFGITSIITCNLSITSGIVPNQLKIALGIPLFKSGEQDKNLQITDPCLFYLHSLKF